MKNKIFIVLFLVCFFILVFVYNLIVGLLVFVVGVEKYGEIVL